MTIMTDLTSNVPTVVLVFLGKAIHTDQFHCCFVSYPIFTMVIMSVHHRHPDPDKEFFDGYIDDDDDDDDHDYIEDSDDVEANLFFNIDGGDDDEDIPEDENINDDLTCAVRPDPKFKTSSKEKKTIFHQRAIKASFSGLIKIRNKHHKRIFIETVQKFVIKNAEIAVRCGMIMHHVVMNCVTNNINNVPDFCDAKFVAQALKYVDDPNHELLIAAKEAFDPHFTPEHEDMDGRRWLLGYLTIFYRGNIISSTKKKWKAVIKDSIDAYGWCYLRNVSTNQRYRIKAELRRQILTPGTNPPNNVPVLDARAIDLVAFHRNGFLLEGNQVLDQRYINSNEVNFRYFILHYGYCLQRQENLENMWNNQLPSKKIGLKKRLPLPFYRLQQRKSIHIDARGLYYLLRQYRSDVRSNPDRPDPNFQFPNQAPHFPTAESKFSPVYAAWMRFLFRIDRVLDGTKVFKTTGVGMTTNAVCASILYYIPRDTTEDDEDLLRCIEFLSLTPHAGDATDYDDESCNATFNEVNQMDNGDESDHDDSIDGSSNEFIDESNHIENEEEDENENLPGYMNNGMFFSFLFFCMP